MRRRRLRGLRSSSSSCDRPLVFRASPPIGGEGLVEARDAETNALVGEVYLERGSPTVPSDAWKISWISVEPEARRCRLGTRLYEQALEYACARGGRLVSDTVRSQNAQRFWEKQVSKGRASCIDARPGTVLPSDRKGAPKKWPCRVYAITTCPQGGADLSGLRRRRRKKTR